MLAIPINEMTACNSAPQQLHLDVPEQIAISPNPVAKASPIVQLTQEFSGVVSVYSLTGQRLMRLNITDATTLTLPSNLSPGQVVLHFASEDGTNATASLIIQ